jgi:AcrR family transcriptional regulator
MRSIAQREDIRDLILDAVDILLARYGYKKMTMDDLAQLVGIGKGTIYLHFLSKGEVTLSHIDRIVERLLVELKAIAESNDRVEDKIKKMLVKRVLFRFDSVRNYTQSLNDLLSSLRGSLVSRRQAHFLQEAEMFEETLQAGKEAGILRFSDSYVTAQVLIQATNSLLPYSLTARELGKRKEIEEQVLQIANVLLHGLIWRKKPSGVL